MLSVFEQPVALGAGDGDEEQSEACSRVQESCSCFSTVNELVVSDGRRS